MKLFHAVVAALVAWQATQWTDQARHRVELVKVSEAIQLEVLDFGGSNRPIVLLAGLGNTAHVFDDFAPKLTSLGPSTQSPVAVTVRRRDQKPATTSAVWVTTSSRFSTRFESRCPC